jgi:hypothetical protein
MTNGSRGPPFRGVFFSELPIADLLLHFSNGVFQGSFTILENVYLKHQERSADAGPATEPETPRCLGRKDRMRQQQNGLYRPVNLRRFGRMASPGACFEIKKRRHAPCENP